MGQSILIENNEDLRKVFSINLSTFTGTEVIHRKNADDTINLLKILPQISLIITRASIDSENTAQKIFDFLKTEKLDIPMIILGDCPPLKDQVILVPEPISWDLIIKFAANALGVTLKEVMGQTIPDYQPVGIYYFYDINTTPCDVYIRIRKGPGDYQFVKRIHSQDKFEANDIKKYEYQGLRDFYILKDYLQYFVTFVTNEIIKKLEREDLNVEKRILTIANAFEIVKSNIIDLKIDETMIELSNSSISSMVKSAENNPEMTKLLKFLFSNKVSFAYQHCHLVAVICHYILTKQSWYQPGHLHLLSFVSFFSDITLKTPNQIHISSMSDLSEAHLNSEDKQAVLTHAKDATELLKNHPDATDYMKTIIMQQHGKIDGVGFEDNPSEDLHPLVKIFIIADNFVKIVLQPEMPYRKSDILNILYERFKNPSYHKIIKALELKYKDS